MFTIMERIKDHEDAGAWITCLWMAACVVIPIIMIVWGLGSSYAWFWEGMCIVTWAGLFLWVGGSFRAKEAAACETEAIDEHDEQDQAEDAFEEAISRKPL